MGIKITVIILLIILLAELFYILRLRSTVKFTARRINEKVTECERYASIYELLVHWMLVDDMTEQLKQFCQSRNWEFIAIYGYGPLGHILEKELKKAGLQVSVIIDRLALRYYSEVEAITPDKIDDSIKADVIVVTAFLAYPYITRTIEEKCKVPVVNLEEIIYSR